MERDLCLMALSYPVGTFPDHLVKILIVLLFDHIVGHFESHADPIALDNRDNPGIV